MALQPLASKGNYFHIYDFRVQKGRGEEFIRLFDAFDYSDENPMHKSSAQVKDGVLCRDVNDPDHFYLLGEDLADAGVDLDVGPLADEVEMVGVVDVAAKHAVLHLGR